MADSRAGGEKRVRRIHKLPGLSRGVSSQRSGERSEVRGSRTLPEALISSRLSIDHVPRRPLGVVPCSPIQILARGDSSSFDPKTSRYKKEKNSKEKKRMKKTKKTKKMNKTKKNMMKKMKKQNKKRNQKER